MVLPTLLPWSQHIGEGVVPAVMRGSGRKAKDRSWPHNVFVCQYLDLNTHACTRTLMQSVNLC